MKLDWDFHELFEFGENLTKFDKFEAFCQSACEEIAQVLLKMLKNNTPVDYGTLKMAWDNENVNFHAVKMSYGYKVILTNSTKYAVWVNDGHKQQPGRFIPGYWEDSKHFRYDPNAQGGMVLKQPFVKGRLFVEISITQLENSKQIEQIVYKQLQNWWRTV